MSGGHCLIAWPKVTSPPNLGGLGISNLQSCAGPEIEMALAAKN